MEEVTYYVRLAVNFKKIIVVGLGNVLTLFNDCFGEVPQLGKLQNGQPLCNI